MQASVDGRASGRHAYGSEIKVSSSNVRSQFFVMRLMQHVAHSRPRRNTMLLKPNRILWRTSRLVFTIVMLVSLFSFVPAVQAQATVTISIDSVSVDKLGVVTVDVTVTCSEPFPIGEPDPNSLSVTVRQPYKRIHTIEGAGFVTLSQCDGSTRYSFSIIANNGRFANGVAYISAFVQLCDASVNCISAEDFLATRIH